MRIKKGRVNMSILNLSDSMNPNDTLDFEIKKPGFRTQILGGYDPYVDKNGITQLGETLFDTENSIVLGGALFVLEKVFGVQSPLLVDYLNNIMSIATTGTPITEIYPKDNVVCLFGVGIGGSGDTITSVKDVKIYEREIMSMIPFRVTDQALTAADLDKYWFKKRDNTTAKTSYYLKKFETNPQIKVLWKDAEGDADGSAVEAGVHNTTRTEPIETFVELNLKVGKNDCREWFELNGNIEQTRVNSIGLFTGIKSQLDDGTFDYKQVKLFSKLNINNEMLTLAKDLTVIYRIYTS
jgi:hypothetical protein